jgi:hypothetical protein
LTCRVAGAFGTAAGEYFALGLFADDCAGREVERFLRYKARMMNIGPSIVTRIVRRPVDAEHRPARCGFWFDKKK